VAFGLGSGRLSRRGRGDTALLAEPDVRDLSPAQLSALYMDPGVAAGTLNHGPSCEGFLAETGDGVPRVFVILFFGCHVFLLRLLRGGRSSSLVLWRRGGRRGVLVLEAVPAAAWQFVGRCRGRFRRRRRPLPTTPGRTASGAQWGTAVTLAVNVLVLFSVIFVIQNHFAEREKVLDGSAPSCLSRGLLGLVLLLGQRVAIPVLAVDGPGVDTYATWRQGRRRRWWGWRCNRRSCGHDTTFPLLGGVSPGRADSRGSLAFGSLGHARHRLGRHQDGLRTAGSACHAGGFNKLVADRVGGSITGGTDVSGHRAYRREGTFLDQPHPWDGLRVEEVMRHLKVSKIPMETTALLLQRP